MIEELRQVYLDHISEIIDRFDGKKGPRFRNPGKYANEPLPKCKESYKDLTQEDPGNVWVWSDLHFGHKNIIRFSDRPFANLEDMENQLVANFNECVGENDTSIWVGDVAFQADSISNELLNKCNGYKILVIGNHDFNHKKLRKLDFDETHLVYFVDGQYPLGFTHFPIYHMLEGVINIHGHQHVGPQHWSDRSDQHINVNCEFHGYKPVTLKQLQSWARMRLIAMEG